MDNELDSTYITITDEDGTDFEMELLDEIEMDGQLYYALANADVSDEETEEIIILKVSEEDSEEMLVTPDDDDEAERAFQIFMDRIWDDSDDEDTDE